MRNAETVEGGVSTEDRPYDPLWIFRPSSLTQPSAPDEATALLVRSLDELRLEHFVVAGDYVRFDETTRQRLKDLRQLLFGALARHGRHPTNFLLWGAPGSGKTYLIDQIAADGDGVASRELNLAALGEAEFRDELRGIAEASSPTVCLIDEVDSKPSEPWPYELLLPVLEPAQPTSQPICYCLVGSGGADLEGLKARIRARPKGNDLLSRIPRANEFTVDSLGPGDKLLVTVSQLLAAAREEGSAIGGVEKLALFYIATNPALGSARALRNLAEQAARRLPPGEDRIKYDHLFAPGDPENKAFWNAAEPFRAELAHRFVEVASLPGKRVGRGKAAPPARAEPDSIPRPGRRLAVLPLANISPDPNDAYLADGLTEELISAFSKIGGLRVIARSSVERYKASPTPLTQLGAALGISAALTGSVRKSGSRIRVTLRLVEVRTEESLWTETYDRPLDDVFAIQADVAERAARVLQGQLLGTGRAPAGPGHQPNLRAYELYLRGVAAYRTFTDDSFEVAVDLFDRAIQADPEFSGACSQLAHLLLGVMGQTRSRAEIMPRAAELVERALRLTPDASDAHSARANFALQAETDWPVAEREFRTALEMNPSDVLARFWYGFLLKALQRYPEAVTQLTAAIEDDPANVGLRYSLMMTRWSAGDLPAAIEIAREIVSADPSQSSFHAWLGMLYLATGQGDAARAEAARTSPGGGIGRIPRAQLLADLGDRGYAESLLAEMEERARTAYVPLMDLASLSAIVGRSDRALDLLEADLRNGDRAFWLTYRRSCFDGIRDDPRFIAMLRELRLPTSHPYALPRVPPRT
jgi:TolB-like protein/Flp pilus assembly protein TadD